MSDSQPKIKTHIKISEGVELVMDANTTLGSGIAETGHFILHCRRWEFELIINPKNSLFYEKDGVL